jgi:ADP-ribose pyrophosphatase YjhB (NUDIX family)
VRKLLLGLIALGWEGMRLILRRPLVGVLAVARDDAGRVLLIRRAETNSWGLPGGLIDYGETIAEALARELREESGYELVRVARVIGVYSARDRDPRIHSICIVVEAEVAAAPRLPNPLEIVEVRAFAADALPQSLAYDTGRMLDDWRAGGATRLA